MTKKLDYTKIKIIFSDIDGTIVNNKKEISPTTVDTIKKLKKKGILFIPCTGRGFGGVSCFPSLPENIEFSICYDGGIIFKISNGIPEIIKKESISSHIINFIEEYIIKNSSISTAIFSDNKMYHYNISENHLPNFGVWGAIPEKISLNSISSISDVQLVLTYGKKQVIDSFLTFLKKHYEKELNFITYKSKLEDNYGLIIKNNLTHKGEGMKWLLNHLNIDIKNSMAIGDWLNDFSMIDYAQIGVAMKNGEEEIKKIANTVTEFDNNEFGAIKHIEKWILQN